MITYSAAISACEKAMQSEWALEQKRTGPFVITCSAPFTFSAAFCACGLAFGACGQAKQSVKALELLEVMRHKGLAPSLILYDAVVSPCEGVKQSAIPNACGSTSLGKKGFRLPCISWASEMTKHASAQQTPVIKKVYVFQHLLQHFLGMLGSAFHSQTYHTGDKFTMRGEIGHHCMSSRGASCGSAFRKAKVRLLGKHAYFGEQAPSS